MEERKQIIIEDVQDMLVDGKTRDEIGSHYGLNGVETKRLFSHPELKGRRTHKAPTFDLVSRPKMGENQEEESESCTESEGQLKEVDSEPKEKEVEAVPEPEGPVVQAFAVWSDDDVQN